MKNNILKFLGLVAFCFVLVIGGAYLFQRDMMYLPQDVLVVLPQDGTIDIHVETEDGLTLHGFYKAPSAPEKPVIIWFHGNASNIGMTGRRADAYTKAGYGVLAAEYRGYNGNPGKPSEDGFYKDGRAFIEWLKAQGVPESSMIFYGESIGSGVAVQMAYEYSNAQRLVLESPFTSATDIAALHYPYLPVKWLLKDKYDNLSKIKVITVPIIIAHGARDRTIPFSYGKTLFDAAPEPKSMIALPDGDHNTLDDSDVSGKILSLLSE